MMNAAQLQSELRYFTGTEQYFYHQMFPKFRYTDGVRFLAQEAGAYWLLEKIFSNQILPEIRGERFQFWKLSVTENQSANLTCEDGNGTVVYAEKIDYTDFPLEEITFFFTDSVLLLPSEY